MHESLQDQGPTMEGHPYGKYVVYPKCQLANADKEENMYIFRSVPVHDSVRFISTRFNMRIALGPHALLDP